MADNRAENSQLLFRRRERAMLRFRRMRSLHKFALIRNAASLAWTSSSSTATPPLPNGVTGRGLNCGVLKQTENSSHSPDTSLRRAIARMS